MNKMLLAFLRSIILANSVAFIGFVVVVWLTSSIVFAKSTAFFVVDSCTDCATIEMDFLAKAVRRVSSLFKWSQIYEMKDENKFLRNGQLICHNFM